MKYIIYHQPSFFFFSQKTRNVTRDKMRNVHLYKINISEVNVVAFAFLSYFVCYKLT